MAGRPRSFRSFDAGANDGGRRLDRVVRKFLPAATLGSIYRAIRTGGILVNGARRSGDYRISQGDSIELSEELLRAEARPEGRRTPHREIAPVEEAPAAGPDSLTDWILFENEHILVANKPRGTLAHGPDSLDTLVRSYLAPKLSPSLSFRSGPLHRLDRNTSGLLAFGVSVRGAERFTSLLREGRLRKVYLALLDGALRAPEEWEDALGRDSEKRMTRGDAGGKLARTQMIPLLSARGRTLAAAEIQTGRTHQIRAQAALHGHPLSGDRKYGSSGAPPYLLHAYAISLPHRDPILGFASLCAPLPSAAARMLQALFGPGPLEDALSRFERMALR